MVWAGSVRDRCGRVSSGAVSTEPGETGRFGDDSAYMTIKSLQTPVPP